MASSTNGFSSLQALLPQKTALTLKATGFNFPEHIAETSLKLSGMKSFRAESYPLNVSRDRSLCREEAELHTPAGKSPPAESALLGDPSSLNRKETRKNYSNEVDGLE